jgi:Mg2+ and Co2+ transporter CorA
MNDTLFVLTIFTTLWTIPMFLAGIFGMNFVTKDGSTAMPLLKSDFGYPLFWVLEVGLGVLTLVGMKMYMSRKVGGTAKRKRGCCR